MTFMLLAQEEYHGEHKKAMPNTEGRRERITKKKEAPYYKQKVHKS
jgi:hypothetical protein